MAKTADRKLEIAKRITEMVCDEHGLDRELLIFDVLTFTLTTGDDEWKPSAVETIEGDRKSTRLNSSHANISYAVFCLKKKKLNVLYLPYSTSSSKTGALSIFAVSSWTATSTSLCTKFVVTLVLRLQSSLSRPASPYAP